MKIKYIFPILTLCLLFFCSCKKEKEQLYGISIDAKKMMKTPAEIFSLQEIQFFQASNDFILSALPHLINEDTVQTDNFVLSPFFLYFTLAQDSTFEEYLTSFENHYQTSSMTQKEREKFFNSFLESVSKIDSSINIVSKITDNKSDSIHIYQQFRFQTQCNTSTTYQPKDYRENFLNISGDYFCLEDMEQYLVDIPVGNGNYLLTLIKPKKQTLKQYLKDFDEKQYAELLKETKSQKINFSFPILEFSKQEEIINLSDTCLNFSFSMPKKIILDYDFKIENSPNTNISFEETLLNDSNKEPLIFDKDFLFILRGKNSNFIMCIGYYGFEN